MSPAQLANQIGVQRSGISHILSGRNKPSLDFVLKVLDAFPGLNEKWLLRGEGEMFYSHDNNDDLFAKNDANQIVESNQEPEASSKREWGEEEIPVYGDKTNAAQKLVNKEIPQDEVVKQDEESEKKVASGFISSHMGSEKKIKQLIIFYDDDSFKVYYPENK